MPRPLRIVPGGYCYHVINRGNGRANVFHKEDDFAAFLRIMSMACERTPMRLLAWCLMTNHFHLVLWPFRDGDLPAWMQWVTTCHVRRYHRHYKGSGHVWQGRYKCFPAQSDQHLLTVLRYVERNPVRAGMVARAQEWRFSSAAAYARLEKGSGSGTVPDPFSGGGRLSGSGRGSGTFSGKQPPEKEPDPLEPDPLEPDPRPIEDWLVVGPTPRPEPWLRFVNRAEEPDELEQVRQSVIRGSPFGEQRWRQRTADRLGLESTLRARGRPRKVRDE